MSLILKYKWLTDLCCGFPGGRTGKEPACRCSRHETDSTPGSGRPPEEGMATHSSILAWRIPWTEEPGGLLSMGWQRVGHNWGDLARTHCCCCCCRVASVVSDSVTPTAHQAPPSLGYFLLYTRESLIFLYISKSSLWKNPKLSLWWLFFLIRKL